MAKQLTRVAGRRGLPCRMPDDISSSPAVDPALTVHTACLLPRHLRYLAFCTATKARPQPNRRALPPPPHPPSARLRGPASLLRCRAGRDRPRRLVAPDSPLVVFRVPFPRQRCPCIAGVGLFSVEEMPSQNRGLIRHGRAKRKH